MSLSHLVGVVGLATMVVITGVVRTDKPIGRTPSIYGGGSLVARYMIALPVSEWERAT